MSELRILVLGKKGQIARALTFAAPALGVVLAARGRPTLDITRPGTIADAVAEVQPAVIINTAAYTDVDLAECDVAAAFETNAIAAGSVADAANAAGVPLIHLSTDYVFDGEKAGPYSEFDCARPISVYGQSKYAGERAVADRHDRHVIVRTSWVYSSTGNNFVCTLLRLARGQNSIRVVQDQTGCPSSADDVAWGLLTVAKRIAQSSPSTRWGVLNVAGAGYATRFTFASAVFALTAKMGGPTAFVEPIESQDFKFAAPRPANSRLDCAELEREFGITMPHWSESLPKCLSKLMERNWICDP